MVDTVKLLLPINEPMILSKGAFEPLTVGQLVGTWGTSRTYLNPSPTYAKIGKYMPRLTLYRRPTKTMGIVYQLSVEFSAPKMLFMQNFDELTEADFEPLLKALREALHELTGHQFFPHQLANAVVASWHPSKNIVFLDYTSCQTILNTIAKLDISRIYDLQRTNFRDGHVVHIHCNSLDIAFYDKMADLRRGKVSEKRAFENDNAIQLNLLEPLQHISPIEVLRYEVRFVGRKAIKRAYPDIENQTFKALFKKQLSQDILLKHWNKITSSIDMLSLDERRPYELFQNYLIDNPDATPQASLAATAALLINGQEGIRNFRNLLEARYNPDAWYRIKKTLKTPQQHRYTHFQHVDEALKQFTPTRMSDYLKYIE
ncbi:MAG TPA: hypothetical protein VMR34_05430 [Candidatus Saccharimonadales bacterium]|nr:hypothetical protein [Candidatus Saccharimonadales bacterium]